MINCPYCGTMLSSEPSIPPMSKRRRTIYDNVSASGSDGVTVSDLVTAVFPSSDIPRSAFGMVRVQICEINKIIGQNGQKITAIPKGAYRLISTGGCDGQEA